MKKSDRTPKLGFRRWLAAGALAASTAASGKAGPPPQATTDRPTEAERADGASSSSAIFSFQVDAAPLGRVLEDFERQTGWRVAVVDEHIRELQSPGVRGDLPAEKALQRLLRGIGVAYELSGPTAATLRLDIVSTTVSVRARPESSSPKYTQPVRDTPQTISIIPRSVMEEQGATTLTDVLRNVPGLTVVAGEGGNPAGDNLRLRGFSARNDIFVDGVRDIGPQSRDPFNLEQVEVVKGPQSAITGRGSTGGSINMVSKSPTVSRFLGGTFQLGTNDAARVTADINIPTPFLGDRSAFRLNLLGHKSGVAGRDVVENKRWGAAPSLALGLGTPTRLTLSYAKVKQDNISDYGIPWVPANHNVLAEYRDKAAPVPRETFYGFPDRDRELMNSDMATVRVEHDFNDGVTFRNQFRYGRSTRDSMATPPRFDSPDTTVIKREMRSWITEDEVFDDQLDLTARFETGAVRHAFVTGGAFSQEGNSRKNRTAPNALTTLLNPNPDDVYEGEITLGTTNGDIDADSQAFYAFDTMSLGRRIQLNGGFRAERFAVEGVDLQAAPVANTSKMLSTRVGAVFHPAAAGTLYASYGTSFNPSLEGLGFVSRGEDTTLEPERTYTSEVGAKWDLMGDRLLVSGALFSVNKANARTPGILPDDPPQILDGQQRVQGVELSATGNLTAVWTVFSAYTYLDSEILESSNDAELGNRFPQTPDHSFNLWTTYVFPWRVTLGGGVRYVGRRYSNTSNSRSVNGYWTVDAMASVPLTKWMDLRANLSNASNEYYFERLGGGHLIPGAARTLAVSTNFRF